MVRTCIRVYSNKIVKYLCAEVRADRLEGSQGYRFSDMSDIRKLIEISCLPLDIRLDCRNGYVYLTRNIPPSLSSRVISTAMVGELFLLDLAAMEFKAASRSHFELHYKMLDKI